MNKIDRNSKLEQTRKENQPIAKEIMKKIRSGNVTEQEIDKFIEQLTNAGLIGSLTKEDLLMLSNVKTSETYYPMMDGELTEAQRESKQPVGTNGLYRMYRWECLQCTRVGRKLPYSEMQTEAIKHYEETGHKMQEVGGVFPKKELYTY